MLAVIDAKGLFMGTDISLFSGYNQKENRTTNYCLLMLKLLYEENPRFLGEVLASIAGEEVGAAVGVQFRQQSRKKASVPDGIIVQQPLSLYIEAKNTDWFSDDQLERHLAGLAAEKPGHKVLIGLSNFEALSADRFARIDAICADTYKRTIAFRPVRFEEFVEALPEENVSKRLRDTLDEFEAYLEGQGLLPRWKTRLDVVNCAGLPADVLEHGVYICPATRGQYSHKRAMYFGMYKNKTVRQIARIDAVVTFDGDAATLDWKNDDDAITTRILARAEELRARLRPNQAVRVFLLSELFPTDFRKPTSGGLRGNKTYFDVSLLEPKGAADLASKLDKKTWAELPKL